MYDREYNGKTYTLEASGGLINASLVMQDKETDSYWAIMTGEVIAGKLKGLKMRELPVAQKMKWKEWKQKYPQTLVLSVNGWEDAPEGYRGYFESERGFRGISARDRRLKTKEPIFAFRYEGRPYAVPHAAFVGGKVFQIGDAKVFLYRPEGAELFYSTHAYLSGGKGFERRNGVWVDVDSGCRFNASTGRFEGQADSCPSPLAGFDTFWYTWSLSNPETEVLGYTH